MLWRMLLRREWADMLMARCGEFMFKRMAEKRLKLQSQWLSTDEFV